MTTRTIPTVIDMERCALSCMMQAPDFAIPLAAELLAPESFANPAHALVFSLIMEQSDAGKPVDPPCILRIMQSRNLLTEIGGPATISEIYTAAPNPADVTHYAKSVADCLARKKTILAADALADAAADTGDDAWRDKCGGRMLEIELAAEGGKTNELMDLRQVIEKYLDYFDKGVTGLDAPISTGLSKLDELMCGGIRREYMIVGGQSGHGKTLLTMQMAGRMAAAGRAGLVVGYEMSAVQMLMRDIARETGIPLDEVMGRSAPSASMANRISRLASEWMQSRRVYMLDNPRTTPERVAAYARKLKRQGNLDFIIVDYLQLVPVRQLQGQRRDEVLGELSAFLCRLRRELDCAVIAPVQLNDQGYVRDSRAIVHPAEVFLCIEMDADEDEDGKTLDTGVIKVVKNRYGISDRAVKVRRDGARQTFTTY